MARSTGPIYVADNSVTAINDALQQFMFMIDALRGQHDNDTVEIGPHTHSADSDAGGAISHDDLVDVTENQHHDEDHQSRHNNGGLDPLKLDDLATPDNNTDLDSTTIQHGLLPRLSGLSNEFLNGQGNFASVTAAEATDIANIEGDATSMIWEQVIAGSNISITELANGSAIEISSTGGSSSGSDFHPFLLLGA